MVGWESSLLGSSKYPARHEREVIWWSFVVVIIGTETKFGNMVEGSTSKGCG